MAENMRLLCYRVAYTTGKGQLFTHIVHKLDDAIEIRKKARKEKHKILCCDKLFYQADYTIKTVSI